MFLETRTKITSKLTEYMFSQKGKKKKKRVYIYFK